MIDARLAGTQNEWKPTAWVDTLKGKGVTIFASGLSRARRIGLFAAPERYGDGTDAHPFTRWQVV
jgi:hypothetical protein